MKMDEDEEEAGNAEKMATALLAGEPSKADVLEHPGFRFHPTDEELVGFYLRRKVERKPLRMEIIKQMDIYRHDPWDLPVNIGGGEETYFFCQRGRKYRNSIRPNRVTVSGFWKATGIDRPIYSSAGKLIGLKKSLVYYVGNAGKGTKTDWMMHEFRRPPKGSGKNEDDLANDACLQEAEIWTICRIFKRNVASKKYMQAVKQASTSENHIHESPSISCSMDSGIDYEHKQSAAPRNPFEQVHCSVNLPNHDDNYPSASDLGCSFACHSKVEDLSWEELRELMDL